MAKGQYLMLIKNGQHFWVNQGASLSAENIEFRNGYHNDGGGSIHAFGTIKIMNCTFWN